MRFWTLVIIAVVVATSGCRDDRPNPNGPVNEDTAMEEFVPLPESLAALQTGQYVVGMIEFFPSETAGDQFPYYELPADATFLGVMEVDALCLLDDGSVVVYDHEAVNRILCRASSSESAFLSALAVLNEFFEKCAADGSFDEAGAVEVRDRCTEIAGGEEYRSFFVMMLGV